MAIPGCLPAAISTSLFFSRKRIRPATLTYPGVCIEEIPSGALLAGLFFGGYTRSALGRVGPRPSPSREAVPGTVAALALQDAWQVGHGDYLAEADGHLNTKHLSSAHLVAGVLSGGPAVYPPP